MGRSPNPQNVGFPITDVLRISLLPSAFAQDSCAPTVICQSLARARQWQKRPNGPSWREPYGLEKPWPVTIDAAVYVMSDNSMDNFIPKGLAAVSRPDPACVLGTVIWVSSVEELG